MIEFSKKILFVGYGAVAECTLPILFKHIKVAPKNVTVIDFESKEEKLRQWTSKGVRYVRDRVTEENMHALLGKHLSAGDVLIDLAWNIDACEILQWCHDNGILYINTSVEVWDPYAGGRKHPTERTLYWRHMNVRKMYGEVEGEGGHGGRRARRQPGAHLALHQAGPDRHRGRGARREEGQGPQGRGRSRDLVAAQKFNHLAKELGVKVIHCSERDTQITDVPKQIDEFVNTWSIEGFREEGTTTSELGWGTHEKTLPAYAYQHKDGPKNQICIARMGINTWVRSWVPNYTIQGMVVRHGEAFTISDKLTVWEGKKAVYRPTVHYAYCPCDEAVVSLNELRGYNYELQPKLRIMNDEITKGADILGALIMGHAYNSWWVGSDLTIEESRRLVPHQNATTMQVAISVVAATMWMIENPAEGIKVPDDLPHEYVLGDLEALPRELHLHPLRLDAAARLQERVQRVQQAGLRC